MMRTRLALLTLLSLLSASCLESLSVGLSTSAVVDAGDDEPDATLDEPDPLDDDAGEVARPLLDGSVADASDDAESDTSPPDAGPLESCEPAYCAPAGLIMDKLCNGGDKICLRDAPGVCSWHCL